MNHPHKTLLDCFLKLEFKVRQYTTVFSLKLMLLLTSIVFSNNASATTSQAADGKKIWVKKCFTCHGNSDHIARNFLTVVDGELQGPIHKETFKTFLSNHYLSKSGADSIYSMLLAQANSKSRFELDCGSCHKNKAELVYQKLVLNNGILYSKNSQTPTYRFLETHRNLNKKDVRFFMKELTLTAYEIYVPLENK